MKMERARFHLQFLDQAVAQFARRIDSGDAYQVSIEYEPEAGEHVFRLRVLEEPPSVLWGIVAGDVIHNMRSALDHLIEQLTIRHSGRPLAKTEFPVFVDADKFGGRERSMIGGCSPAVREAIRDLQPYHRNDPTTDPLWKLHDLWNMDKHRVVPIVGFVSLSQTFSKLHLTGGLDLGKFAGRVPFVDGAEIGRMLLADEQDPEASVKLNPPIHIVFEHSGEQVSQFFETAHDAAMHTIVGLNSR